jgi:hypothetical protein
MLRFVISFGFPFFSKKMYRAFPRHAAAVDLPGNVIMVYCNTA